MTDSMPHEPNETEWDVLAVLWDADGCTAREVAEALEAKRGWAYSTVKTMLDRMKGKGLVHARRVGNVWEYRAAIEPAEAKRGAWRRFLDCAFGGSLGPALEFIASDARLSRRQREQLRRLLEEEGRHDA
jgi:BlaI family penicillinase repressor